MIKNYTSKVSASKSVQRIENRLVSYGAYNILKLYEDKILVGIAFIISVDGKEFPFRLPAKIKNVEKYLNSKMKRPTKTSYDKNAKQAERTAWKIISDWVDIQISIIELDQAEFIEVFLPYIYNYRTERTFFQEVCKNGFKQIENHVK